MVAVSTTGPAPATLPVVADATKAPRRIASDAEVVELCAAALGIDPDEDSNRKGPYRKHLDNLATFYAVFRRWGMAAGTTAGRCTYAQIAHELTGQPIEAGKIPRSSSIWRASRELERAGLLRCEAVPRVRGRQGHLSWELLAVPDVGSVRRPGSSVGGAPAICEPGRARAPRPRWKVERRPETPEERAERRYRPYDRKRGHGSGYRCGGAMRLVIGEQEPAPLSFSAGAFGQPSSPSGFSNQTDSEPERARSATVPGVDTIEPPAVPGAVVAGRAGSGVAVGAAPGPPGAVAAPIGPLLTEQGARAWPALREAARRGEPPVPLAREGWALRWPDRPAQLTTDWARQLERSDAQLSRIYGTVGEGVDRLLERLETHGGVADRWQGLPREPASLAYFVREIKTQARAAGRYARWRAGRRESVHPKPHTPRGPE